MDQWIYAYAHAYAYANAYAFVDDGSIMAVSHINLYLMPEWPLSLFVTVTHQQH